MTAHWAAALATLRHVERAISPSHPHAASATSPPEIENSRRRRHLPPAFCFLLSVHRTSIRMASCSAIPLTPNVTRVRLVGELKHFPHRRPTPANCLIYAIKRRNRKPLPNERARPFLRCIRSKVRLFQAMRRVPQDRFGHCFFPSSSKCSSSALLLLLSDADVHVARSSAGRETCRPAASST